MLYTYIMLKYSPQTRGQVSLEYVSMAVLVMLGVLVMGTYVTRSINAYFKNTDDAVEDSLLEEILPAHNIYGPGCTCGIPIEGACGDPCRPWEKQMTPNCS